MEERRAPLSVDPPDDGGGGLRSLVRDGGGGGFPGGGGGGGAAGEAFLAVCLDEELEATPTDREAKAHQRYQGSTQSSPHTSPYLCVTMPAHPLRDCAIIL